LEHSYKELRISSAPGGGFLLEKNALHIWPRHQFMMIALPNADGSFTCTLFLAQRGGNPSSSEGALSQEDLTKGTPPTGRVSASGAAFDDLDDKASVLEFFDGEFPDAVPLMPTLVEVFFENPTGELGTLRCWPWNIGGKVLLLGDAAHAMVPFYGQGMNCAFEDVRVLASLIDEQLSELPASAGGQSAWKDIFDKYSRSRMPNADAIQAMAEENFYEMRDRVADPVFQRKRELETMLEQKYADYFSKYSMVTFREDMPYSEAMRRGNAQDALLMEICSTVNAVTELDLDSVMDRVTKL
jgi:kynurenine 3-monooxygenase